MTELKKEKTIYDLELNEIMEIPTIDQGKVAVIRVPGGWIYSVDYPGYRQVPTVFVAFHNEFMPDYESKREAVILPINKVQNGK